MIEPTIGRILLYHGGANDNVTPPYPCAAMITGVVHNREVHVRVFGHAAGAWTIPNVLLLQDQDQPPPMTRYCKWMEYQQGQAAKADALEERLNVAEAEKKLTGWIQNQLAPQLGNYGLKPVSPNATFSKDGSRVTFTVQAKGYDVDIVTSAGQLPSDSTGAAELAKVCCQWAAGEICQMAQQDGKTITREDLKLATAAVPPAPRRDMEEGG